MKTNRATLPAETKGVCMHCAGKGRVIDTQHKGKLKRTKTCYHCRGTGTASTGYTTKKA